jgi:hypothetical protein
MEVLMIVPDGARKFAAILAVSVCAVHVAAPAAYGCAFHNTLPEARLDGMHPGSLSVAVALRKAADSGVIDAADLEALHTRTALYIDSVARLHKLRRVLAASPAASALPASFSLGYVESGLWTRYARSVGGTGAEVDTDGPADGEALVPNIWTRYAQPDGEIGIQVHTDGPADGEAVVLTGEPVLRALLAGTMSADRAVAEGLVIIDADERETAAIRQALMASSSYDKISAR